MIEADHHPSLHVDFGKFLPKLASYVNYLFAQYSYMTLIICIGPYAYFSRLFIRDDVISHDLYNIYHVTFIYSLGGASDRVLA